MELGPERKKEDECDQAGARASPSLSSSSRSCDDAAAAAADKELPKQQQRASGNEDDDDDDEDDEGTRQPYKCTFCRRGFPTAQALGGHMNVHRRQRRVPPAPAAAAASTGAGAGAGAASSGSAASVVYDYDQPCSTTTTTTPVLTFAQQATTRPAPAGVVALHAQRKPQELLPLFGRGSGAAAGDVVVREDRYLAIAEEGDGGEELDLELRLGGAGS